MKKPRYVLDSFALLAYFQAEAGGEKVLEILKKASSGDAAAILSAISLGEILYIVARKRGEEAAVGIVDDVFTLPIDLVDATIERVLAAARIKARHPISYADAFVVSAAEEFSASVVTGDPEFKQVEPRIPVHWL